jgi:ubiquinone/menaquinone biosynthesis C-methylase UbiE
VSREESIQVEHANRACYDEYYDKPWWWFALRYDTQIKRKTCLYLLRKAGVTIKSQRVLEIGFGSGAILFSLDRRCELHGLELSTSAVSRARRIAISKGYRSSEFKQSSTVKLPYGDGLFDVVIASHVLEHVSDDCELLREMRRVLASSGVAIVLVPINERYADANHMRSYAPGGVKRIAQASGFASTVEMQNELLFHLVEAFYFRGYNKKWPILGPAIAAAFNIPAALMPFWLARILDRALATFGLAPRQAGYVFTVR